MVEQRGSPASVARKKQALFNVIIIWCGTPAGRNQHERKHPRLQRIEALDGSSYPRILVEEQRPPSAACGVLIGVVLSAALWGVIAFVVLLAVGRI